jgi:3-deoxy-D-manno-octulosonic-acid transferase
MASEASARGIPLGMISATLSQSSGRTRPLAASLLREAYSRLDLVGAIDESDAARLVKLGVLQDAVRITGDTRYDQVWARVARVDPHSPLLSPLVSDRLTVVAGSTWPSDERMLLNAWGKLKASRPALRLVIAPHEPTRAHLEPIERWARDAGLRSALLSEDRHVADWDVLVVDQVGVLGELYSVGDIAFVGGGFHSAGLHSVLEPAAAGLPVLFGPRHTGSRDAGLLMDRAGAIACEDTASLTAAIEGYAGDRELLARAGAAAREVVRSGLGAAKRSATLVMELMKTSSGAG